MIGLRNAIGRHVPGARAAARTLRRSRQFAANLKGWATADPIAERARLDLALALAEPPVEPLLHPGTRTLYRCEVPGSPSGVICSLAVGEHIRLLSVAIPTLFAYGQKHGWDVVLSTEDLSQGRAASWGKLPLIRSLMDEYDLVWWVDADALLVDLSTDIRTELHEGRDLHLVEHPFPTPSGFAPSAGVMVWRSGEWSRTLIDEIWQDERYGRKYPWENAALLEILGYTVEPFFTHLHPTDRMARVCYLTNDWNGVWSDPPAAAPRVHHHGGSTSVGERRNLMLGDLSRWRSGAPPRLERPSLAEPPALRRGFLGSDLPSAAMTRDDLPLLLNERDLTGRGVELGVYGGEFSAKILTFWKGELLISIDPWAYDKSYEDISNVAPDEYELLWLTTSRRLERFGVRSEIWRTTGEEAVRRVEDGTLDFVYIDARHDEASVRKDLGHWYPKVRPGGIFSGHDYLDGHLPEGVFGVKSAVDDFAASIGSPVHMTGEVYFPSWIIEVPSHR